MTIPLIERFRERLPVSPATPVVSLGEGSTPLLRADRLARAAGLRELWLKWEASNPTGSYKDRGMTVAVSKALEAGAEAVICASTGNTAASAAAYATRAGLPALVLTPQGAVSGAKLAQTRMLGATVLEVRGDFDAALGGSPGARLAGDARPRQLAQPGPPRRAEDRRLRDRRGARRPARRVRAALRRGREHLVLRAGALRARARGADRLGRGGRPPQHDGDRDPDRRPGACGVGAKRRRTGRRRRRRRDRRCVVDGSPPRRASSASRPRQRASLRCSAATSRESASS